jgi:hypothetical protein
MAVQWYQVQSVLNDLEEARTLLRMLVADRVTVSGTISGPVVSIAWNNRVEESVDRWLVSALTTSGRVHDLVKRIRSHGVRSRARPALLARLIHFGTAVNRSRPAAVNAQTAIATRQASG